MITEKFDMFIYKYLEELKFPPYAHHSSNLLEGTFHELTASTLNTDIPVLVSFWAPWCKECRQLNESLKEIKSVVKDKVKIITCNVEGSYFNTSRKYPIKSIPVLMLFKKKVKLREIHGYVNKTVILNMLKRL